MEAYNKKPMGGESSDGYGSIAPMSLVDDEHFTNPHPITITWENLNYWVEVSKRGFGPKPRKQILKNLNGIVRPGQLLAIMGSTGAGKSSLLDALAMR